MRCHVLRHRVLLPSQNPNPAGRGGRNPLPKAWELGSGGPISPLRKGRQIVFGPWSASRPLAAVEGSGGTQHPGLSHRHRQTNGDRYCESRVSTENP